MITYVSKKSEPLEGSVKAPGDKSLSHRILMLAVCGEGKTTITGLLDSADIKATSMALEAMGASIHKDKEKTIVEGIGKKGFLTPKEPLNLGNAGTGARLLAGLLVGQNIKATIIGDASLSKRPMNRIVMPLKQMGARIEASSEGTLPLHIQGVSDLKGITYTMPIASAQVKTALLLAGLYTKDRVHIIESEPTRDHTERLFTAMGLPITYKDGHITMEEGDKVWKGIKNYQMIGDASSSLFLIAAGVLVPGSKVTIHNVGMNEGRIGGLQELIRMGGSIQINNYRMQHNEPVASITVEHSPLRGIKIEKNIPYKIDEIPILAMLASKAKGTTYFKGIKELKYKESNRLQSIVNGLIACGVNVSHSDHELWIEGGSSIKGGTTIDAKGDHRIVMAFSILGLVAENPITIMHAQEVESSFPNFLENMQQLGASIIKKGNTKQ